MRDLSLIRCKSSYIYPPRTPQPRSGSRPHYPLQHGSHHASYQPLSRSIAAQPSRLFAPSPRRCLLLSRPLPTPAYISNSLPSSPTGYPTLTDRLRAARTPTPTLTCASDPISGSRPRPGSARGTRRPNIVNRPRPGSLPRANSVPGKHLRRPTPPSSRYRPSLEPRLQTSSTASAVTAPSGIVAEGKMTIESDREGSGREALSRALRAVSRNGSLARSRSWSRSETDEAEPPKPQIQNQSVFRSITYPVTHLVILPQTR
ncbi:hypothetical protein CROQUDRAFT_635509 [Cronartium quercuum f. sp. fusiforme G11]|uniref:Uncharacterized protein n=1 Tax=Cronartium quercuum f. sp. fusiforme G11 TaxID=708437 RepID=A0A9P6TA73_9BASI|nr:hypothetical protein CROQUDRAFT_635509 [Cronartium quercuum f. sp. fusiforme G11]